MPAIHPVDALKILIAMSVGCELDPEAEKRLRAFCDDPVPVPATLSISACKRCRTCRFWKAQPHQRVDGWASCTAHAPISHVDPYWGTERAIFPQTPADAACGEWQSQLIAPRIAVLADILG